MPIFTAPDAVVLSSEGAGWSGIAVEEYRFPSLNAPAAEMTRHIVTLHLSPPLSVEWLLDGRSRQTPMAPGDVCLLPQGLHESSHWPAPFRALAIAIDPPFLSRVASECGIGSTELVPSLGSPDPKAWHLGLALKADLEGGCAGGPLFAETLATTLALHLLTSHGGRTLRRPAPTGGLSPTDLRRALDFIHDRLEGDLSLAEIAGSVSLSVSHFTRRFKVSTGQAPHQYLIARRVEEARRLLLRGNDSVGQIAARVGFASHSHLNRHFNRLLGVPPSAFLRQNGMNVQEDATNMEDGNPLPPP